jgi:hypothetical protein
MTTTTNAGVARSWARNDGQEAKSGNGNFWHNGAGTLYSYRTPIGRIVPGGLTSGWVYLITSERYSVTTQGKHIGPAHRATGYKAFSVPDLGLGTGGVNHGANLAHYAGLIEAEEQRLKRARTHTSRDHIASIQTERARYCAAFGLPPVGWDKVEG